MAAVSAAELAVYAAPAELSPAQFSILPGALADHHGVHQLLQRVHQAPSAEAFTASLEDSGYSPRDRLVVRHRGRVVAHALVSPCTVTVGLTRLPAARIAWLAASPELPAVGMERRLLDEAEARMLAAGNLLSLAVAADEPVWRQAGYAACGLRRRLVAGARDLLALLSGDDCPERSPLAAQTVRPWRHVELCALVRLYENCAANSPRLSAASVRGEERWTHLSTRRAYDRIYVAVDGAGRIDLEQSGVDVCGYVIVKDGDIVELMAPPDRPAVAHQLVKRVCGDAVEASQHDVSCHAPDGDIAAELFLRAGGTAAPPRSAERVVFARVPQPRKLLAALCGELHRRAAEASLERPCELGLVIGEEKLCVQATQRSVRVAADRMGRSYLRLGPDDLTRLLLGAIDVRKAVESGRVEASTKAAEDLAAVLFPKLAVWVPPFEDLLE